MGLGEKLIGLLSLPKEVLLNLPVVTMTGCEEINIENYKGLIEYVETKIRISTGSGILVIEGRRLTLKRITAESIVIAGEIAGVTYLR